MLAHSIMTCTSVAAEDTFSDAGVKHYQGEACSVMTGC